MKTTPKIADTEDIGHYESEWYMVRERRLVALEAVADAARAFLKDIAFAQANDLQDALDALER